MNFLWHIPKIAISSIILLSIFSATAPKLQSEQYAPPLFKFAINLANRFLKPSLFIILVVAIFSEKEFPVLGATLLLFFLPFMRYFFQYVGWMGSCHCYGRVNKESKLSRLIDTTLILSCASVLMTHIFFYMPTFDTNVRIFYIIVGSATALGIINWSEAKAVKGNTAVGFQQQGSTILLEKDFIGLDPDGRKIAITDLDTSGKLMLFLMIKKDCGECAVIKKYIPGLAAIASDRILTIVLTTESKPFFLPTDVVSLKYNEKFVVRNNLLSFPSALLVNPTGHNLLSPVIRGGNSVWSLYFACLKMLDGNPDGNY